MKKRLKIVLIDFGLEVKLNENDYLTIQKYYRDKNYIKILLFLYQSKRLNGNYLQNYIDFYGYMVDLWNNYSIKSLKKSNYRNYNKRNNSSQLFLNNGTVKLSNNGRIKKDSFINQAIDEILNTRRSSPCIKL